MYSVENKASRTEEKKKKDKIEMLNVNRNHSIPNRLLEKA